MLAIAGQSRPVRWGRARVEKREIETRGQKAENEQGGWTARWLRGSRQ
jgi:hypothetical protein